ncbi:hypothetical protein CISIN_1g0373182mg, partial [Citrus sinensis]
MDSSCHIVEVEPPAI